MSQPPLSRQIQALERSLGVDLFTRANRTVRLTVAGEVFLPEARRILALSDSAARWTRRAWRGETGQIRLGFTASTVYEDLPRLLAAARRALPEVKILLSEMLSRQQHDALAADILDVGLLRPPFDQDTLNVSRVRTDALVLAMHNENPLAARQIIELGDLDGEDMILFSAEGAPYTNHILTDLFNVHRIRPNIVHQLDQNHSILALVAAGLGSALVPSSMQALKFDEVQFRPVRMEPGHTLELLLAWRPANKNPVLNTFLDIAHEVFDAPEAAH